jgi:hypothetical protein
MMTAMTELQFLQEAGVGNSNARSATTPSRKFAAIASFLRSHGHFEVADVVDGLRDHMSNLQDEVGIW